MKCCQKLIDNRKSKYIVLAINTNEEQVFFLFSEKRKDIYYGDDSCILLTSFFL